MTNSDEAVLGKTDDGDNALIWSEDGMICINTGTGSRHTLRCTPESLRETLAPFGVFEKAPTDDDREALIAAIHAGFDDPTYMSEQPSQHGVELAADRALAAGFRRTEVPEPSAGDQHDIEPWSPTGRIESPVSCKECDRALFVGADGSWQHVPRPEPQGDDHSDHARCSECAEWPRTEPQGEPSDAQAEQCGSTPREWLDHAECYPCAMPKGHRGDHATGEMTWPREESDALSLIAHAERVGAERDDPLILELAEALRAAGGVR